ncbi:MAG: hypothetical protein ACUVUG_06125 [Candidatus Aminicenantia bacterium]
MKIIPLASDSLGTRSMATFVETDGIRILIDPGVALGPFRDGLPPHPEEIKRMNEEWDKIVKYLQNTEIVIITHYHYDHFRPSFANLFKGKKLFLKSWEKFINRSQRGRAENFLKLLRNFKVETIQADGKNFEFSDTKLSFSKPVTHGVSQKLGYVIEVFINDGKESFLFTSDVQGPCREEQMDFILEKNPNFIYVDGPLSYLLGRAFEAEDLKNSINNLKKIINITELKQMIIDHHLLRDLKWKEPIDEVLKEAEKKGVKVSTSAEFIGKENQLLEARRKELYGKINS